MTEPPPIADVPPPAAAETAAGPAETRHPSGGVLGVINDYITLTKPPIILLLLITAAGGMFLAQGQLGGGLPSLTLLAVVWLGGALASGGANALNHYFDRDIDGMMRRTRQRPVVSRRIRPAHALLFGIGLNLIAALILGLGVNLISGAAAALLAAGLTMTATLFYVLVYTLWLKRTTPQNIVIGGAAGAFPPMVGWAAVTGSVDLPAVYLFAIVFFWTPPHFWALALLIRQDYAQAGVPMLPVVSTRHFTVGSIFLYSLALVGLTAMFALTAAVGWLYAASALLLGGLFLALAWRLKREETAANARKLYLYSLLYLALLFVAIMVSGATGW